MKTLTFWNICKLLQLNSGAQGEHLSIEFLWSTQLLLVMTISPFSLVDEFIFLFLLVIQGFMFFVSGVDQGNLVEGWDWFA